jgi:hypothetical protein
MKSIKKTIKRIIKTIKNKPADSITIGVDIKNCKDCEYKNPLYYAGRLKSHPKFENKDIFLKLSPEFIPDEYTAKMLLDIIKRYCNHNKQFIRAITDKVGSYTSLTFIQRW